MSWQDLAGAALGAGATIGGAWLGANAIEDAADDAIRAQMAMFNQLRADQAPFREVGVNALAQLAGLYGIQTPMTEEQAAADYLRRYPDVAASKVFGKDPRRHFELHGRAEGRTFGGPISVPMGMEGFQTSPGFQFRQQQGEQAIERALAARGLRKSGPMLKDMARFNQGLASEEFGNYANRLAALAGVGQTATNTTGAAGMTAAGNVGNAALAGGQARASAFRDTGSAINQGLNNLLFLRQLG